jgi:hypothetical protein
MKYLCLLLFFAFGCTNTSKVDVVEQDSYITKKLLPLVQNQSSKVSATILIRKSINLKRKITSTSNKNEMESLLITLSKTRLCILNLFLESKENGDLTKKFFTAESPAKNFLDLDKNSFYPNESTSKIKFYTHVLEVFPEYSELNDVSILQSDLSKLNCSGLTLE